jgi:hypothetical protein
VRNIAVGFVLLMASACSFTGGETVMSAEVLPSPLPATILSARAMHPKCHPEGCLASYRIRITNPTDRQLNVQTCALADDQQTEIPVQGISGAFLRPHATTTIEARFLLSLKKSEIPALSGKSLNCVGLDWHGNPPI